MSQMNCSSVAFSAFLISPRTTGQAGPWLSIGMAVVLLSAGVSRAELVGWWQFDDVVGDSVPDSSGFMNNGTLMNGATTSSGCTGLLGRRLFAFRWRRYSTRAGSS